MPIDKDVFLVNTYKRFRKTGLDRSHSMYNTVYAYWDAFGDSKDMTQLGFRLQKLLQNDDDSVETPTIQKLYSDAMLGVIPITMKILHDRLKDTYSAGQRIKEILKKYPDIKSAPKSIVWEYKSLKGGLISTNDLIRLLSQVKVVVEGNKKQQEAFEIELRNNLERRNEKSNN